MVLIGYLLVRGNLRKAAVGRVELRTLFAVSLCHIHPDLTASVFCRYYSTREHALISGVYPQPRISNHYNGITP